MTTIPLILLAVLSLVVFLIWRNELKTVQKEREKASREAAERVIRYMELANKAAEDSWDIPNDEKRKRLIDRAGD